MCMYVLKTVKKGWDRDAKKMKLWRFIFQVT